MHYNIMIKALELLPAFEGVCWRAYSHPLKTREAILSEYKLGDMIEWRAFTSVTTIEKFAEQFLGTNKTVGVIFKIHVTSGRDINAYSCFPQECEILLAPNHRFTVSSKPREERGFTYIDLVQVTGNTFVS